MRTHLRYIWSYTILIISTFEAYINFSIFCLTSLKYASNEGVVKTQPTCSCSSAWMQFRVCRRILLKRLQFAEDERNENLYTKYFQNLRSAHQCSWFENLLSAVYELWVKLRVKSRIRYVHPLDSTNITNIPYPHYNQNLRILECFTSGVIS